MYPYIIAFALTGITALILGAVVLFKNPKISVNQSWFALSVSVFFYTIFFCFHVTASSRSSAIIYSKILGIGAITAIPLFFIFILHVTKSYQRYKKAAYLAASFAPLFIYALLMNKIYLTSDSHTLFNYYVIPGPIYALYALYFGIVIIFSHVVLVKNLNLPNPDHIRIKYLLLASCIASVASASTFLIPYNVSAVSLLALLFPFYPVIVSCAIVKHNLMNINIVIKKTLFYSSFAFGISILYVAGVFLVNQIFTGQFKTYKILDNPGGLNLYSLTIPFTSLFSVILGAFVLFKNPRSRASQAWGLACISCSIWMLFFSLHFQASNLNDAILYAKVLVVSATWMMAFIVHFCSEVSGFDSRKNIIIKGFYINSLLITIFSFTDFLCTARPFLNFNYYVAPAGVMYHNFAVDTVLACFYSQWLLLKGLKTASKENKNKLLYIIVALFCGYIGGIASHLPGYGIPVEPVAMHFIWLYAAIISYAILKHQLLDIKIVIKKTIFYSLLVFGISVLYVAGVFLINQIFTGQFKVSELLDNSSGLNPYSIPPLIGTIVFLFLGFSVLFHKPRTSAKVIFSVLCFETFFWQFIWFYSFYSPTAQLTYLAKIVYLTITFLPFTFYHFIASYLDKPRERKYVLFFYGVAAALVLLLPTNFYVAGNRQQYWGNFTRPGPFFVIFVVTALYSMGRGLILIQEAHRRADSIASKNQMKYLFVGFSLYFLCAFDFLQVYGANWYPVGTFFFLLSAIFISYAIMKHGLLDIRVVIKRTLFYSLLAIAISLLYLCVVFIFYSVFLQRNQASTFTMNFLGILFIAITFKPLELLFHRLLEKRFFKGTISEISEQKAFLEGELERRERLKSVGILAAGMAHEIKNPLTAINTFAEYLPTKYDDPEFRENFSRIVKQEVARMRDIVTSLLVFSKPSEPNKREFDVKRMVMDILELLSNDLMKNKIKVEINLVEAKVFADPDQIKQAMLNIIMNAMDAMRGQGGTLSIRSNREGNSLVLRIEDSGCGIPKDKIAHIFDPFFTQKEGGTGLGLAITHSIIEKNAGKIRVESVEGKGTTFTILLPAT